jgi:ferric-dicitrate binding protein FerR (iron transport regulator)
MPVKKSERSKTAAGAKQSAALKTSTGFTRRIGAGAVVFVAMCGIALLMVMAAREPAELVAAATADTQPGGSAAVRVSMPALDVKLAGTPVAASATPSAKTAAPVTLAGCLQRTDQKLRLKDTVGADAPKARSWKSGFLKKGSGSIDLVDPANRLRLANHVGHRVTVTGTLDHGEMQVRSLQRVSAVCK